jgi:hypothetical protein
MTQEEIKLQPHKMVNGIAILLTESEISELNQLPSEEDLLNQLNSQKQIKINQCQSYLKKTDWYIIRMSDPSNATVVPEGILINRANARVWQDSINSPAITLEELNQININFN